MSNCSSVVYNFTYIMFTADILLVLVEIDLIFSKYGRID